jgi:hypothetical protein
MFNAGKFGSHGSSPMMDVLFVLVLQAAGGEPAEPAQPPAPAQVEETAPAQTAESQNERHRLRCRMETLTGSRMGTRVCRTQAEQDAQSNEGRRLLENAMRMWDNQSSTSGGSNGP